MCLLNYSIYVFIMSFLIKPFVQVLHDAVDAAVLMIRAYRLDTFV